MILVSYDGSDGARAALDRVARLMPGAEAVVLTVWETFTDTLIYAGSTGMMPPLYTSDTTAIDDSIRRGAEETAETGAALAVAAGLDAKPRTRGRLGGVADTILHEAAAVDADLVVMGTRGLGGVKSLLLGSVSHALLQSADRAVMIVPSPVVVEHRRERHTGHAVPA